MAVSGQITVAESGTPVAGPAAPIGSVFQLKAHPSNTDTVWVGTKDDGFPLDPGESTIRYCNSLAGLTFDADVGGEKVCYILIQ